MKLNLQKYSFLGRYKGIGQLNLRKCRNIAIFAYYARNERRKDALLQESLRLALGRRK
ncbi:hypothetical protein [Paenibacillus sp. NEAU-GSW1]|uniref:hypothetical protein n=1 Tax=Paenibacillus sp. NEAU-GSW1 TaxID=2682486 RepID=UPI0012E25E10|nr:hypothetical protein [Paenibacillus sp. NEAU-GSW1]MUT68834.1 hypothetical protein [Paenibacillus sp. NEAU-GSW1]